MVAARVLSDMHKEEYRAEIQFLVKVCLKPTKIDSRIVNGYRDFSFKKWDADLKIERKNV